MDKIELLPAFLAYGLPLHLCAMIWFLFLKKSKKTLTEMYPDDEEIKDAMTELTSEAFALLLVTLTEYCIFLLPLLIIPIIISFKTGKFVELVNRKVFIQELSGKLEKQAFLCWLSCLLPIGELLFLGFGLYGLSKLC